MIGSTRQHPETLNSKANSMSDSKSTIEEIRERFDREVERYANLETGQSTIVDARLALEVIQGAALRVCPGAKRLLDLGCGAGNYTLKLLEVFPEIEITLIDLSRPMLDRALQRLALKGRHDARDIQGDIRDLEIGDQRFDLIVSAMVLHHLRAEGEWKAVYQKLWRALKPGGSLWISDFVDHAIPEVHQFMWERYGEYLSALKDSAYRDHVFAYVTREDTPRPLTFQMDLLKEVGFRAIDILHKNTCFAVFAAIK